MAIPRPYWSTSTSRFLMRETPGRFAHPNITSSPAPTGSFVGWPPWEVLRRWVDEATDYQEIWAQRARATVPEKFIAQDRQPWTRPSHMPSTSRYTGCGASQGHPREEAAKGRASWRTIRITSCMNA